MEADILHSIGYHQHVDPHGKTGSTTTKTPQTPLRVRFQSNMCGLSFHVQVSPRRTKQSHTKYLVFDTGRWHARCIRRWTNAWSKAGWSCGLDSVVCFGITLVFFVRGKDIFCSTAFSTAFFFRGKIGMRLKNKIKSKRFGCPDFHHATARQRSSSTTQYIQL